MDPIHTLRNRTFTKHRAALFKANSDEGNTKSAKSVMFFYEIITVFVRSVSLKTKFLMNKG